MLMLSHTVGADLNPLQVCLLQFRFKMVPTITTEPEMAQATALMDLLSFFISPPGSRTLTPAHLKTSKIHPSLGFC